MLLGQNMKWLDERARFNIVSILLQKSDNVMSLLPGLIDELLPFLLRVLVPEFRDLRIETFLLEVIRPNMNQLFGVDT